MNNPSNKDECLPYWLTAKNKKPSPSELTTFQSPYSLRKTNRLSYDNQIWTVGDIAYLVDEEESDKTIYAQVIELYENDFCIKKAKIEWLVPKANLKVSPCKMVFLKTFKPEDYTHVNVDHRLFSMTCLTFVMHVPDLLEYRGRIGTNYLVDTQLPSHAERYAESDEDDGPKSKSKVRRLLNK